MDPGRRTKKRVAEATLLEIKSPFGNKPEWYSASRKPNANTDKNYNFSHF
jgi:hypothetical protein